MSFDFTLFDSIPPGKRERPMGQKGNGKEAAADHRFGAWISLGIQTARARTHDTTISLLDSPPNLRCIHDLVKNLDFSEPWDRFNLVWIDFSSNLPQTLYQVIGYCPKTEAQTLEIWISTFCRKLYSHNGCRRKRLGQNVHKDRRIVSGVHRK